MIDLRTAAVEIFDPCVGQSFGLSEPASLELTLAECNELKYGSHDGSAETRHPFRLVFTTQAETQLDQGTYALNHDQLGVLEIFLVPVAEGQYEAIFN